MATSILTDIDTVCLTSHLPEVLVIDTEASQLQVNVIVDKKTIFKSIYYPYEKVVKVRDIRSLVESAMEQSSSVMSNLSITVYEPQKPVSPIDISYDENGDINVDFGNPDNSPDALIEDVKVVYCRLKPSMSSSAFLTSSFLNSRRSILIPRDAGFALSNYSNGATISLNTALIYYRHYAILNVVFTYQYLLGKSQSTREEIITKPLSHSFFKSIVDSAKSTNCTVLGVEYQIGLRHFNIFFTDETPTDVFRFQSAFNIMETAYLYNTTTIKTEVERSEAVCGHQTQFYDETIKRKYEVETAPLTIDEAEWLNQMLTSKRVMRLIDNNITVPILISDISSEVTDSDKDLIRLKFTWKYADVNNYI